MLAAASGTGIGCYRLYNMSLCEREPEAHWAGYVPHPAVLAAASGTGIGCYRLYNKAGDCGRRAPRSARRRYWNWHQAVWTL